MAVIAAATAAAGGCSTAELQRTLDRGGGDRASVASAPTSGRASNGLADSTAPADRVQAMPAPGSCHYRGSGLFVEPDPRCAPGALNPAVTQANIGQTIGRPGGYTSSVRPAEAVTEAEKRAGMTAYGNTNDIRSVEWDHFVPLSLGGAVNDGRNYFPEPDYPHVSADSYFHNPKDRLELVAHDLVCQGRLGLAEAQRQIALDWVGMYRRVIIGAPAR